jgi:hypothetical protein
MEKVYDGERKVVVVLGVGGRYIFGRFVSAEDLYA